jgi:hypothetical protein
MYVLPAPIACGMCGAIAGLFAGGLNQCFPVWVGAVTGGAVGCIACIYNANTTNPVPVASVDPVVVVPFCVHEFTGNGKPLNSDETVIKPQFPHTPL